MAMSKYFRSRVIGLNPRADNIAIEKEEKKVADELKNRALIVHTIYTCIRRRNKEVDGASHQQHRNQTDIKPPREERIL
jgi:hypothetical protein